MKKMVIKGISTHNLKNINISVPFHSITAIYGRSGAGKSSLAFSTIYKLCCNEFDAIEEGFVENTDYKVHSYLNLIPAVGIAQKNTNNNPRSNLFTYLNIPQLLVSLKTENNNVYIPKYNELKLHSILNECETCKGLGYVEDINLAALIDVNKTLKENPFIFWSATSASNLNHNLLVAYAESISLPMNIPYSQLSIEQKNSLLNKNSDIKIKFRAKYSGKSRQRSEYYICASQYVMQNSHLKAIQHQLRKMSCPTCFGSCISPLLQRKRILDFSFIDFLLTPIQDLIKKLTVSYSESRLYLVLQAIERLGLGYLNLARTIPSLSGGELQKIRFSRLLNTDITNILIVIDEISSQINPEDHLMIMKCLKELASHNTIILVEHEQSFIDFSDQKIHIGKFAGIGGGYICPNEIISPFYDIKIKNTIESFLELKDLNQNNVIDQKLSIPLQCLTVFTGVSGSGKSSLAKAIEDTVDSIYISQKNASYSVRSILASSLSLTTVIANYFSNITGYSNAIYNPLQEGGCPSCSGIGVIKYERGYEKDIYLNCPICEGTLFDKLNPKITQKVNGISIVDLYELEIMDIPKYIDHITINRIIKTALALGLGHLKLNRKTQTLSGGELRRIRLCNQLSRARETDRILIIDEPAAGLDPETASSIASYIYSKVKLFKAVIIIDHKPEVIRYADFEVKLGPGSGPQGGKIIDKIFYES